SRAVSQDQYRSTIAWGDNQTSDGPVTANGQGGFDVWGEHSYAAEGAYTVRVRIADRDGARATATSTARVLTVAATEGQSFTAVLGSFSAASAGASVLIDWGDGGTSAGTVAA